MVADGLKRPLLPSLPEPMHVGDGCFTAGSLYKEAIRNNSTLHVFLVGLITYAQTYIY